MVGKKQRLLFMFVVLALLVAIPTAAFANKQVYKARISYANELHEVVGSTASGSGVFATNADGSIHFLVQVRGLSAMPTGAHLHGPADETQTAGVVVTLCGNPQPGATGACPFDEATGTMTLEGDITGSLLRGITGAQFFDYLQNGLLYFNVHTALNPAGEARGQLLPR